LNAISWLCVWIVMFPLVVPATPSRTLAASLLAASMWPIAFVVGVKLGNAMPEARVVFLNFLENYLAAFLALVPTLIIRRLGKDVQRAREMGSYELVELLDRGGMGEVWRARHRMLARPAAIKLVRADALGSAQAAVTDTLLRRFEREAQATAALQSPHTVELYDYGVTADGTFFYVMEMLDGVNLETLVKRFGPLPAERVIHLLLQACDSLADAHHAGLVHRDIKPANIQVCRRGRRIDFVKVLDFGLVKAWGDEDESRLTLEGAVAGTPAYMAPELAMGGREVDGRADLYALGCVAYWLVTGRTVFQGASPMQVALQHVQAAPLAPSQTTELPVPLGLERLILDCLEKDPQHRPATAAALAEQLAALTLEPWTQADAQRWWEIHFPNGATPGAVSAENTATLAS
jgi:serine/threonine-protein kinase